MKLNITVFTASNRKNWLQWSLCQTSLIALAVLLGKNALGADIVWDSTGSLGAGQWTNTADWTGGVVPGAGDIADFNSSVITGNANITVNDSPVNTLQVGSIIVGNNIASNFRITAQSTAVNPTTINLNGIGGILLSNYSSSYQIIITNASASPYPSLDLGLGNNGMIYCYNLANNNPPVTRPADSSGGEMVLYSSITGTGSITNTGPGVLYFGGVNTYSGSTTLANGTLELGGTATIGSGSGTVYFVGGNLETGGSSTTRITTNTFVINTAGNAYIYNASGTAGTRVFAFKNNIIGTSGTLVFGNVDTTVGEYLDVQLLGSFTFNLPLVVGDNLGDAYSDNPPNDYSEMQLANTPGIGTQTFGGNISGDGPIIRGNLPSVPVTGDTGTTIFTGSNSYSGGTIINSGTLLANNTAGSALGTGTVTVTNLGILGGNGMIGSNAAVTVYQNGTIQPGSSSTSIGILNVNSGLTFDPGANYNWLISAATGTPGTAWDLINCSSGTGWTDAGASTNAITIYVNSGGVAPTGWNDANSYSWMIITNNGSSTGFNAANWTVNTAGFAGAIAGVFSVANDANGDLLLNYTPTAGNIIINVPSGSVSQGGVSPTPYPVLTGLYTVTKVGNGEVVMTNSLNSYQGATYIYAGTASAAVNSTTSGGAFGASTAPIVLGNSTGTSNATLNIDAAGVSIANDVTVQAGSSGTKTIGTTITSGSAANSGDVTLGDNVTLSVSTGGTDLFSGDFSGTGGITFAGGGTYTMSGNATYSGTTTLTGGTLDINANSIGTNIFTISALSTLDNTAGGTVTLANNPPQIWNGNFNFGGSGALNLGTGPVTMTTNCTLNVTNNVLTVAGTIAGTGYGLTLVGPGELSLAGATNSTYTGITTNFGGILGISATATFGIGTNWLVFNGGNLLSTGTRGTFPISNPVMINQSTRVYGNSTDLTAKSRVLPFSGPFTVTGGSTLYIDDTGLATTIFNLRLFATNGSSAYTNINWPIVIGDSSFDVSGTICQLDLQNDDTTPVQVVSSLITGTGQLIRSGPTLNTGGTSILTQQNTFSGGVFLDSGTIGLGASSVTNSGGVVSGPLGTGELTMGEQNDETALTLFAPYGPVELDNAIFLNGDTNFVFAGTNNMLLTAAINSGGVAKTMYITNGITVTLSGAITNTGSSTGGALTKAGGGTLILNSISTYAGTTTVNDGTLLVNGALATNSVAANSGSTLGGTGVLAGDVTYSSGSQAYLYKTAGSPDTPLTVSNNLTANGNTITVNLGGTTTLGTGTYNLIYYGGTLTGSFNATPTLVNGSLAGGNSATIDITTPNEVNLVVTPSGSSTPPNFPPGSFARLSTGNISLTATGAVSTPYRLWATTNVALHPVTTTWTLLQSGTISSSPFTITDLTATNYPHRFYLFTSP